MHFEVHAQLRKKISLRFSRERSWVLVVKIYRCREKIQKISWRNVEGRRFTIYWREKREEATKRPKKFARTISWPMHVANPNKSADSDLSSPTFVEFGEKCERGMTWCKKKKKTKKQNKNLCPPGRFTRARGEKLTPRNFAARGFKYREYHANIRSLKT